jgi:hypothetical protein
VPFDFLKRRKPAAVAPEAAATAGRCGGHPVRRHDRGLAPGGPMMIDGRMSDALNKREPDRPSTTSPGAGRRQRADGAGAGLKSVDPYDLVIVLTATTPSRRWRTRARPPGPQGVLRGRARGPPYRCRDRLPLPGSETRLAAPALVGHVRPDRGRHGVARCRQIGTGRSTTILVNRQYLRGVEQVDVADGGAPREAARSRLAARTGSIATR